MREDRLTIRVTGKEEFIPFASFLAVAKNTLSILQGLDATFSEDRKASVTWRIEKISMNSPLTMTIFGESATAENDKSHEVIEAYANGVRELERGTYSIPPHFTIGTLKELKQASNILNDGVADVAIFLQEGAPIVLTQRIAANVDTLIGPEEFEEYTTLEGRLEMLSVHERPTFNIYDVLHKSKIACYFPKEMLDVARNAFNHRIAVTGKARYKRNGFPFSIQVESLRVLRDKTQLPQMRDLEGINITGDIDPTEYIREMRDAE